MTIFSGNREACSQAFSLLPKKGERRRSAHRRPSCAIPSATCWSCLTRARAPHDRCRGQGDRCGTV